MNIVEKNRNWLILQYLREAGPQPRGALIESGDAEGSKALGELLRAKCIKSLPDDTLALTWVGAKRLREVNNAKNNLGVVGKRTIGNGTTTEPYTGRELRRTCLRPGAYDAFELPSLMGNERHYRREIAA